MIRRGFSPILRIQFLALTMLLGVGAIVAKLWWVQVAHGAEWTARIRGSSEATVRVPSIRGEIRDRNGISLVQNRASYEVDFYLPEMVKGYRQRYGQTPQTGYRGMVSGMPKDLKEPDMVKIVNNGVVPRLDQLKLAKDYNSVQLQKHYRNNTEVPYTYIKDIDFGTMAKFSEHDVGLPGVDIAIKPVRSYVYGALAAHLLGYVGPPDETNKDEARKYTFFQGDVEGKSNIEKTCDQWLRGKPGVRYLRRNAKGVIEGLVREEAPKQGANVYLTLDARIQAIAEDALRSATRAAAVVVDPGNGNVLAMASVPSFDPNTFIPSIKAKDWQALQKDEARPLVSRAVSAFPPGSTFKIITALAGLRKKIGNTRWNCSGGVSYGDHYFHCWIAEKGGAHGTLGLTDALKVSCDSFFYQYGNAAGIEAIDKTGEAMGMGKETGIHLTGEQPGIMPGPEWMAVHYPRERWSQAYTANVSIGQGYVLATPLQMALAYATVANGGISYYPRLIDRVLNQDGTPLLDESGKPVISPQPKIDADLRHDFTADQIEMVRRGLWKVVNEEGGTGNKARIPGVQVAGKTGTAQAFTNGKKDTTAWFCSFAPYDHPKYAIAVMVQGGEHGGSVAAPIANRILSRTLAMDAGTFEPQVAWLAPAHHPNPFAMIKEITYKDDQPSVGGEDEEHGDDNGQNTDAQMAGSGDSPDVEPEADQRGQISNNKKVMKAQPVAAPPPPPARRGFFSRLFGGRQQPAQPTPPPPARNPRGRP